MIEANKYKLGLFVLSGMALLVLVLFLLGIAAVFKPKVKFVTLFDESVQGLETGAPVKFRGVTIGKVSSVTVRPSDNLVRVDMEAELSAIDVGKGKSSVITRKAEFFYKMEKEVEKGLRCRLDLTGITGLKYVEINYYDPRKNPIPDIVPPKGVRYIPSTPSFLRGLSTNLTTTLARIANINFEDISTELLGSLKSINSFVSDPRIGALAGKIDNITNHLDTTTANINKVMTESNIREISDGIKKSMDSINDLSKSLQKQIEEAKISETAAAAREMRSELSDILNKLGEAIDSFTELVKNIDDDPSSMIRGKQSRPVEH
ncbi:MAG: MlaD family protein [Victivallales bacterium]